MGVSKHRGTPKSSILIGFSIINHPFWGTPIFGNTHIEVFFIFNIGFFGTGTWNGWNLLQGSVEASPSVGLDVGTTNSAVAVRRADGRFVVIPPPGPNGTNRGSSFAAESWKKQHDMVMYINRLGLFWHVLHIKQEEEKKEIIHTLPDYRSKLCKTLAIKGNNRPNQQFDSRIWGEPTPVWFVNLYNLLSFCRCLSLSVGLKVGSPIVGNINVHNELCSELMKTCTLYMKL